jgi:hypothetical protein
MIQWRLTPTSPSALPKPCWPAQLEMQPGEGGGGAMHDTGMSSND